MLNENLTDRVRRLEGHKVALEVELKRVADELVKSEGLLKLEQERTAAIEDACRANEISSWLSNTRRFGEYLNVEFKGT